MVALQNMSTRHHRHQPSLHRRYKTCQCFQSLASQDLGDKSRLSWQQRSSLGQPQSLNQATKTSD
jgi:hypothetical protein